MLMKVCSCPVVWYSNPEFNDIAADWGLRARNTMKSGDSTEKVAVYTNFRAGIETAEELWGNSDNVAKIGEMKKRLDPGAMFQSIQVT